MRSAEICSGNECSIPGTFQIAQQQNGIIYATINSDGRDS
jgi:hypothetical protein